MPLRTSVASFVVAARSAITARLYGASPRRWGWNARAGRRSISSPCRACPTRRRCRRRRTGCPALGFPSASTASARACGSLCAGLGQGGGPSSSVRMRRCCLSLGNWVRCQCFKCTSNMERKRKIRTGVSMRCVIKECVFYSSLRVI